jgi:hypothetical protein
MKAGVCPPRHFHGADLIWWRESAGVHTSVTLWGLDELFGRLKQAAEEFLKPGGIGLAFVESEGDLAVMHLSHHEVSGVYSAEHFMPSVNYRAGNFYSCCGS